MYRLRNNLSLFLISIIWLFCIIPAAHAVEIILDNNSAGTVATGTWTPSAGANSYGTQSLYSRDVDATYSYTVKITEPGTYDVNLWWTEYFSRSTNVAVDIKHRDGTARVHINQKQNGGEWNNIGSWYFTEDAIITIYSDPANNSTNADAVQLLSVNPGGSNSAPTLSGTPATTATVETAYRFIPSANDADGDNLTFNISNSPTWADFDPSTGALTGTPESQDEGTTTQDILISVSDGALKASLPAFSITVAPKNSGGTVIELIVDDSQPGTRSTGTWTPSAGLNFYGTRSLYSRDTDATYSYTIKITESGTYDVNLWWTEYFSRSTKVPIDITHSDGTTRVYVDQKQNGGQWNNIGSWYFAADAIVTIHSDPANNSTNADAVQLVSVNSGGNNSAPTISGTPATTVTVETAYSFIPSANDVDGDNLDFTINNQPRWANFNSQTGALTGTPESQDEGTTQDILISVSDGTLKASLPAFSITVAQENPGGPAIELILDNDQPGTRSTGTWIPSGGLNFYGTRSLYSRDIGATYSYTIPISTPGTYDVNLWWTAFFNRSSNVAIEIQHRDGTARVEVNQQQNEEQWNKIGSWYFTTDAIVTIHSNSTEESTNADAVQLVSVNSGGNSNSAPTISGTPATSVTVETAYSFIPSANDVDGDNLDFTINNKPSWADFNPNTGALTGTPESQDEGITQNIQISVSDDVLTASLAAFSITVNSGHNAAPVAQNDSGYSTEQSSPISIPVLDNDRGLDDGPIQVTVIQPPPNGATEVLSNNSIRYTPNNDYSGSDSFVYKITDADGDIATATVTLEVTVCSSCAADVILNLSWDANPAEEDVTGYNVFYGESDNTANSLYKTFTGNSAGFDLNAPSIDTNANADLSLQAGDDVCFRISAYNSAGESSKSAAVCETI